MKFTSKTQNKKGAKTYSSGKRRDDTGKIRDSDATRGNVGNVGSEADLISAKTGLSQQPVFYNNA